MVAPKNVRKQLEQLSGLNLLCLINLFRAKSFRRNSRQVGSTTAAASLKLLACHLLLHCRPKVCPCPGLTYAAFTMLLPYCYFGIYAQDNDNDDKMQVKPFRMLLRSTPCCTDDHTRSRLGHQLWAIQNVAALPLRSVQVGHCAGSHSWLLHSSGPSSSSPFKFVI